jgi:hypothetical protein
LILRDGYSAQAPFNVQSVSLLPSAPQNSTVKNSGIQVMLRARVMKALTFTFIMIAALGGWSLQGRHAADDPDPDPKVVHITNGPVIENVTDTTAVIAWSTDVNAGTMLHYGTDANHLDHTASMPWGGLTHRVNLKDLTPGTTYYFQAESPKAQGTGTSAMSPPGSFKTKPGAACVSACT